LEALGALDAQGEREVDSWLVWDLSAGYELSNALTLRVNIDNLTDEEPPTAYGSARGFDAINHNALGATYRVGMTYRF
tara:strand:- start:10504 stop:10737 length:234 start_codon:yes stop_codon:yes gene_type:complete